MILLEFFQTLFILWYGQPIFSQFMIARCQVAHGVKDLLVIWVVLVCLLPDFQCFFVTINAFKYVSFLDKTVPKVVECLGYLMVTRVVYKQVPPLDQTLGVNVECLIDFVIITVA